MLEYIDVLEINILVGNLRKNLNLLKFSEIMDFGFYWTLYGMIIELEMTWHYNILFEQSIRCCFDTTRYENWI